jgi:hypothetical protein
MYYKIDGTVSETVSKILFDDRNIEIHILNWFQEVETELFDFLEPV